MYQDLYLMSLCQHFVSANSTFSWWGAWLGAFGGKTVIAPPNRPADRWSSNHDIIPDGWIVL